MIIIPIFQNVSARFEQKIQLGPEKFSLYIAWNAREESWYFTIYDADRVLLIAGLKLIPNYWLLLQFKATQNLPAGDFLLIDMENKPSTGPADFNSLGDRYQLIFYTDSEIAEFEVA